MQFMKKGSNASRNQVNINLTDEEADHLEELVLKFKKQRPSQIVLEIYRLYLSKYEEIEEARMRVYNQQTDPGNNESLGKSPDVSKRLGPKRQAS
jgi:hypothetical protein